MKYFCLVILLITGQAFAQTQKFEVISYVTKDSVYVKWMPNSFINFQNMLKAKSTILVSKGSSSETVTRENFVARKNSLEYSDTLFDQAKDVLQGVLDASASNKESAAYAFAIASISASTDFTTNLLAGNMLVLKNTGEQITLVISIDGFEKVTSIISPKPSVLSQISDLTAFIDKKRIVDLNWDAKRINPDYLAFWIERKMENENKFKVIISQPYVHMVTNAEKKDKRASFRDKQVEQGKKYTYRIVGINYFGKRVTVSNEVEIGIPKLVNAQVQIDTIIAKDVKRTIQYTVLPDSTLAYTNIGKVHLLRSDSLRDGYTTVTSIDFKSNPLGVFESDVPLTSGDAYYYKILLTSVDGDSILSTAKYFFTLDQIPPKPITNLKVTIDSLGVARLSWDQNTDTDLQGYKLFRANSKKEEFVQLNGQFIKNKKVTDTLGLDNLTSKVYYFIIAVDQNYNNSVHSDTIMGIKPDTIPPVSAEIIDLIIKDCKVQFELMSSYSEDLKIMELIKIEKGVERVILFSEKEFPKFSGDSIFTEEEVFYYIRTTDLSGNKVYSPKRAVSCSKLVYESIDSIQVLADRARKVIQINWGSPKKEVFQYTIYRKKNNDRTYPLVTLEGSKLEFIDKEISIGNIYTYSIVYQAMNGKRSKKSKEVIVKY